MRTARVHARQHRVDPHAYLADVLVRIDDHPNKDLDDPNGNVSAKFEEIRRVLEREGILPGK